ncbi:MAG: HisA/HisF-related TIM barrel protein [Actinomycetota bacterium]|nr:HisA/HisF-related TIM barrel protein [Actinomycetota bacterium]
MPFEVIPAIDLVDGGLGRVRAGRPVPVDAFQGDPLAAAAAFVEAGARWIHVVDTDLAFTGRPSGLEVIRAIAGLAVRVQASGGLRTDEDIDAVLDAGAARAVLGSAALQDLDHAAELIGRHGERLAVGLEVDGEAIRPRGRGGGGGGTWLVDAVLPQLVASGATRFVVTSVALVGERSGPDLGAIRAVARAAGRPVIAAGGIATVADLEALAAAAPNVEGAIVGSALYEGGLDLAGAIRAMGAD